MRKFWIVLAAYIAFIVFGPGIARADHLEPNTIIGVNIYCQSAGDVAEVLTGGRVADGRCYQAEVTFGCYFKSYGPRVEAYRVVQCVPLFPITPFSPIFTAE